MEIEQALIERLAGLVETPVYVDPRPQDAIFPVVEVRVTEMECPSMLDGGDGTTEAAAMVRVRAVALLECETIGDTIRAGLPVIDGDWSGLPIDAAWCESEADITEYLEEGSDQWAWKIETIYKIQY